MAIRIFIYDDSDERRGSLKALLILNCELKFLGEAMDCKNVLNEIESYYPDVVLKDINIPEVDGIEGLLK
jgi:DNA-binding NarL/FixJ family response regulator